MKTQNRRDFIINSLKIAGTAGAVNVISPSKNQAAPENILSDDRYGVLVDTTVCIGCRRCEWACKQAHGIPAGDISDYDNKEILKKHRRPDPKALTVVNQYNKSIEETNVKFQCMHCDHPACVSACIVGAFSKRQSGAVVWDESKCIGCRYCMVACPFQIPSFEFEKAIEPNISKCDLCYTRIEKGQLPACVEICPVETMTFGLRKDLVEVARKKIKTYPERYINHIFGENEVGGTGWMYLASSKFDKLDFPKLGNNPAPGVSESIQHGIFAYFIPPIALYALLGGIMWLNKKSKDEE